MTFELIATDHHSSGRGPAWAIKFSSKEDASFASNNDIRLVLGFYARPYNGREPDVDVWIERREVEYYQVIHADGKKSPARRREVHNEVAKTRRRLTLKSGMEFVVADALGSSLIVGRAAATAVHTLFWTHLVDDDDGLSYLHRVSPRHVSAFYVRTRLHKYVNPVTDLNDSTTETDPRFAADVALDAVFGYDKKHLGRPFWVSALNTRITPQLGRYSTLCAAIDQVMLTDVDDAQKHALVVDFVLHEATPIDHAYAMIIAATEASDGTALLGLRACQRLEANTHNLLALLTTLREQRPNKHQVLSALRAHFKGVRL